MILRIDKSKRNLHRFSLPLRHMVVACIALLLMVVGAFQGHASDRAFDEYQVKAVFLYRLTLFISWPEGTFATANQPFVIGIVGNDPFGIHIDRVVRDETFNGRPVVVRRYRSMEAVMNAPCQVLFINQALKKKWPQLKQSMGQYPILTVSDMDAFGELGGMINIRTQRNKIKIEINPDETHRTGLKISSKLLHIARNVATTFKGGQR